MGNYVEHELELSTQLHFSTFERVPSINSVGRPSCDPSACSTFTDPAPVPRARRSWLPPLRFQLPDPPRSRRSWLPPLKFQDDRDHPALRTIVERPSVSREHAPLLHVSPYHAPQPSSQRRSSFSDSILATSQPTTRTASSICSRSKTDSDRSRKASSLSSLSISSFDGGIRNPFDGPKDRFNKPEVPAIPAIPARYRHPSHALHNDRERVIADSKPSTLPPNVWMYEPQKQNEAKNRTPLTIWPNVHSAKPRVIDIGAAREVGLPRTPKIPISPERAVLRTNMSKGNISRSERTPDGNDKVESLPLRGEKENMNAATPGSKSLPAVTGKRQPFKPESRRQAWQAGNGP